MTTSRLAVFVCLACACGGADAGTTPTETTVDNPAPSIAALDPDTVVVGGVSFTLTVHGASFVNGSTVLWNGTALPTTFKQATQVTAAVSDSALAAWGQVAVSVRNPTPGGGTSETLPLVLINPAPAISWIIPVRGFIGAPGVSVTITGRGFVPGAQALWDGTSRSTTFVDSRTIGVQLPASDLTAPDSAALTVVNPAPGGGTSDGASFVVLYGTPTVTSVEPDTIPARTTNLTLAVAGSAFTDAWMLWNDVPLSTTVGGYTSLTAVVPDSLLAIGSVATITVRSPAPGGGTSYGRLVTVTNPAPVVASVAPDTTSVGGPAFSMEIRGSNFMPNSRIGLDDLGPPTTYVSDSVLRIVVDPTWFAYGRFVQVTVFTASPGGGISSPDTLVVLGPTPTITTMSPDNAQANTLGFVMDLSGTGFSPSSVVRWAGGDRPTTFWSVTHVTASIPDTDLWPPGAASITVFSPAPGGGESNAMSFTVAPGVVTSLESLDLKANDLLVDGGRGLLYAAVSNADPTYGGRVVVIDPASAAIVTSIQVGSEPGALAMSDDGTLLYVALTAASAIRRVDLATQTAGAQIPIGLDPAYSSDPLNAEDIVVLPGAPTSIAVSRIGTYQLRAGVAVFANNVWLPDRTAAGRSNRIERSPTPNQLYGYASASGGREFSWLSVDSTGVHEDTFRTGVMGGYPSEVVAYGSRLYADNGVVVNPLAGTTVGRCEIQGTTSTVAPDSVSGRIFYLTDLGHLLVACDIQSLAVLGQATVPAGFRSLRRWGTDGLAYTTGQQVVIVRTTLATP